MMQWKTPQLTDRNTVYNIVSQSDNMGNDLSFANIYLLRNKYHTKICFENGFLFREYNGPYGRNGYAFPVGSGDVGGALKMLEENAGAFGLPFDFCFLSEDQKSVLEQLYPGRFTYTCEDSDSDYIYLTEKLASFEGRKYQKHRNRAMKFVRTYPDITVRRISDGETSNDALAVEEKWLSERSRNDDMLAIEKRAIEEALAHIAPLDLRGIVVYVGKEPAAMSIASEINRNVCDIIFEKSFGEFAENGAYSAVCRYMADSLAEIQYINREEDLGISGLRRSKMSYRPIMLYKKYRARSDR